MDSDPLTSQLLIAMPNLMDPNFNQTVALICEHSDQGALGVVINRPTSFELPELLSHLDITAPRLVPGEVHVYAGGPVQVDHGFVIHHPTGVWESSIAVNKEVALTTSRDILAALGGGDGPEQYLVALGYAGWGAGQLEHELAENAWLTVPCDLHILFEVPPEDRWEAAAGKLGIDLNLLTGGAGHA